MFRLVYNEETKKRRAVISKQDALFFGIIKNPTPRNKRNYPVRTNKRY